MRALFALVLSIVFAGAAISLFSAVARGSEPVRPAALGIVCGIVAGVLFVIAVAVGLAELRP